jgi:hypothetical protein
LEQTLQNKRLRYVDKISRTSAGVVLKYLPGSGLNKELEAQKKDLEVLLAHGLLEGNIEADLIDEIANLRMHLGSLEEKLAKMLEKNEAAEIEAAAQKKSQKQAVVASADAAGDAEAAEAADEPANADALASHNTANELPEMDILVQRVSSLESHKDELLMEIHRIKEETNNTNVKLANFEGEFQNSSRRRHEKCSAATTKDSEQSAKVPSDASEDPLDALERQLRREIESVTAQLQALDKRVSDQESPENHGARAADGTGGPDAGASLQNAPPLVSPPPRPSKRVASAETRTVSALAWTRTETLDAVRMCAHGRVSVGVSFVATKMHSCGLEAFVLVCARCRVRLPAVAFGPWLQVRSCSSHETEIQACPRRDRLTMTSG